MGDWLLLLTAYKSAPCAVKKQAMAALPFCSVPSWTNRDNN